MELNLSLILPLKFVEKIYNYEISLDEAKDDQDKLEKLINRQKNYKAKKPSKIEEKKYVLESAIKLFNARKDIIKYIENESKGINYELFDSYFNSVVPSVLVKQLYKTKNKTKNNQLVNVIKSGLRDLKDEIKKMSEDEIKIEKPHKIIDIVEKILEFNEQKQKQQGQGLKTLTPNQMLSRLPIFLAQLKAGNNSEKLKRN